MAYHPHRCPKDPISHLQTIPITPSSIFIITLAEECMTLLIVQLCSLLEWSLLSQKGRSSLSPKHASISILSVLASHHKALI